MIATYDAALTITSCITNYVHFHICRLTGHLFLLYPFVAVFHDHNHEIGNNQHNKENKYKFK
jgi:hypothetical protein